MPVYVQPSDVTNVAPEFTSEQPSRINDFIEYARLFICEDKYGAKAKLAIIYQTAHLLKLSKIAESGAAGAVTSEKVGELQRSYGSNSSGEDSDLASTSYGLMIMRLKKGILTTPIVV